MTGRPSFAITLTVKNEADILPDFVKLYRKLGVSRIFVFFDGTTDDSRSILSGESIVVQSESIRPFEIVGAPDWINKIAPRWRENMDVRKRVNTFVAAREASRMGVEWLLCIDPDEVAVPSLTDELTEYSIPNFLSEVPLECEQVLLKNYEVVPAKVTVRNPFAECTVFKNRFRGVDFIWKAGRSILRSAGFGHKSVAWFSFGLYWLRFHGRFPKLPRDPRSGRGVPVGYYWGYSNHKSMVRTRLAEELIFDVHEWRRPGGTAISYSSGVLLHYFLYDCAAAREKFRSRGSVADPKGVDFFYGEVWRMACTYSVNEFNSFFRDFLAVSDNLYVTSLKNRGLYLSVTNVSDLFRSI